MNVNLSRPEFQTSFFTQQLRTISFNKTLQNNAKHYLQNITRLQNINQFCGKYWYLVWSFYFPEKNYCLSLGVMMKERFCYGNDLDHINS